MLLAIVLIIINIYILLNTREPKNFRDVKERYRTLREHLATHEKPEFRKLSTQITLLLLSFNNLIHKLEPINPEPPAIKMVFIIHFTPI